VEGRRCAGMGPLGAPTPGWAPSAAFTPPCHTPPPPCEQHAGAGGLHGSAPGAHHQAGAGGPPDRGPCPEEDMLMPPPQPPTRPSQPPRPCPPPPPSACACWRTTRWRPTRWRGRCATAWTTTWPPARSRVGGGGGGGGGGHEGRHIASAPTQPAWKAEDRPHPAPIPRLHA
jgi:hypothetical protein